MDKSEKLMEFQKRQRRSLERMKGVYDESKEPAVITYKEDEGEVDILSALYTDFGFDTDIEIMGDYFYRTLPGSEEDMAYLTGIHSISEEEDFKEENLSVLLIALNILNHYIPYGSFDLEPSDNSLVFKMVIPIFTDESEENLFRQLDVLIGHCMHATGQFAEPLVQIMRGEMDMDDFMDLFEE